MSKAPMVTTPGPAAPAVLAPQFWSGRAERQGSGLDFAITKIAVDLQNLTESTAEADIRQSLDSLREATGADASFVAMLDEAGTFIEAVTVARASFAQCRLETLRGARLAELPQLAGGFEHLQITEYRDTRAPRREQLLEAQRLQHLLRR